jgi:hypothetical protein
MEGQQLRAVLTMQRPLRRGLAGAAERGSRDDVVQDREIAMGFLKPVGIPSHVKLEPRGLKNSHECGEVPGYVRALKLQMRLKTASRVNTGKTITFKLAARLLHLSRYIAKLFHCSRKRLT